MTVQTTDNRRRVNAIPFRALWYDNSSVGNQFDLTGVVSGDLSILRTGFPSSGQIRICRPLKGELIEARLSMQATFPNSGAQSLRFYIGRFDTDGITPVTLTEAEIAASWKKISGFNAPISYPAMGNVFFDGLNLLPAIPKKGDADFNQDGWILGVDIGLKDFPEQWVLYQFKIDCTAQVAELIQ